MAGLCDLGADPCRSDRPAQEHLRAEPWPEPEHERGDGWRIRHTGTVDTDTNPDTGTIEHSNANGTRALIGCYTCYGTEGNSGLDNH